MLGPGRNKTENRPGNANLKSLLRRRFLRGKVPNYLKFSDTLRDSLKFSATESEMSKGTALREHAELRVVAGAGGEDEVPALGPGPQAREVTSGPPQLQLRLQEFDIQLDLIASGENFLFETSEKVESLPE